MSQALIDFWLGVLAATTCALALIVTAVAMLIVWAAKRLAKFADVQVRKDKRGAVSVSAEVNP